MRGQERLSSSWISIKVFTLWSLTPAFRWSTRSPNVLQGLDLVNWQFRVASEEKLPLSQEEIMSYGHAVELRLMQRIPIKTLSL